MSLRLRPNGGRGMGGSAATASLDYLEVRVTYRLP